MTSAPALYRPDLEVKDGNRRLMANPAFNAVPYAAQVQRLQKSAIEEGQRARTHVLVLGPSFWGLEPGDVGSWTSARNGYVAKQFRIDVVNDQANLDSCLSITEVDPSDFDWDHATEFKPVTIGPTGNLINATVTQSANNTAIDQAALRAARESQYAPKIVNCQPTTGTYSFRADFTTD